MTYSADPDPDITAGGVHPDVSRLDWLSALLSSLEAGTYAEDAAEDPQANVTMLSEVRGLLEHLRSGSYAASALARRKTPRKLAAHRANAARINAARTLRACTCGTDSADGSRHRAKCPCWKRAYARMRRGLQE